MNLDDGVSSKQKPKTPTTKEKKPKSSIKYVLKCKK